MISIELARALRDSGLEWRPQVGDSFIIDRVEADADVFYLSDLTIEAHEFSTGTVLGFNGTTEWALDSVALEDALWLPREDQLRELLRATFRALRRRADTHEVEIEVRGETLTFEHPQPEDAYALAVLELLRRVA